MEPFIGPLNSEPYRTAYKGETLFRFIDKTQSDLYISRIESLAKLKLVEDFFQEWSPIYRLGILTSYVCFTGIVKLL